MSLPKCPNQSHPDWLLMVELFGEDNAWYLYDALDQEIPTREQIAIIYKQNYGKELVLKDDVDSIYKKVPTNLFKKLKKDGRLTSDNRYYNTKSGDTELMTDTHNPFVWEIQNEEGLVEKDWIKKEDKTWVKKPKKFRLTTVNDLLSTLREKYKGEATFTRIPKEKSYFSIKTTVPYYPDRYERRLDINYTFSLVNALNSIKADRKTIKLNTKDKPYIEDNLRKILSSKGVSSQQIDMLFDYMRDKGINEIPVEDLIISMEADLAYTVEVNTSKTNKESLYYNVPSDFNINNKRFYKVEPGAYNPIEYFIEEDGKITEIDVVEFQDAEELWAEKNRKEKIKYLPTQYYANLTVPGGTNYTEQEIRTPQIVPNIKGHAQFATDNGIGWFRSDDRSIGADYKVPEHLSEFLDPEDIAIEGELTKSRRILEIQSDLFQKGRKYTDLITSKKLEIEDSFITTYNEGIFILNNEQYRFHPEADYPTKGDPNKHVSYHEQITEKEYEKALKEFESKGDGTLNKNQFLQLLNKDNNWVKFFIQSIIQDSAKRGYEKVLFPTGETAAKVEGHETIADEIKNINSKLENKRKEYDKIKGNPFDPTAEENLRIEIENLETRKQNLKTQGIEKLKPIENFYENVVKNILKKLGYETNRITDEYGNEWYEYNIKDTDLTNLAILRERQLSSKQQIEETTYQKLKTRLLKNFPLVDRIVEDDTLTVSGTLETVKDGKVVRINPNQFDKGVAIGHEFGHLFIDLIGGLDNPLVKAGLKELQGTELWQRVVNAYPEFVANNDPRLYKEILAEALGIETDKLFKEEENKAKWERWLIRFFRKLKNLLGIEKSAVRKMASEMIAEKQTIKQEGKVENETYQRKPMTGYKILDEVEEIKPKEQILVDKAIDVIRRKIAIYKERGEQSYINRLETELNNLENLGEMQSVNESLVNFINLAAKEISMIYKRYISTKEKYDAGNKEAFDTKLISRLNEYVSAFNIIEDIKETLKNRIGYDKLKDEYKLSLDYINDIIDMKNEVQDAFITYGLQNMVNFLDPVYTRIDEQYQLLAEKEYLKLSKEERADMTLDQFMQKYLGHRQSEIRQKSRDHLLAELQEAQFDINWMERFFSHATTSDDPIMSAMVKAISLKMMEARLKKTEFANRMWEAQKELETVIPNKWHTSPLKMYDFMLEKDKDGNPTGSIIHEYRSNMITTYLAYKDDINSDPDLSPAQKQAKLSDWKKENAPLKQKEFDKAKYKFIKQLKEEGLMSKEDVESIFENDSRKLFLPLEDVLPDNQLAANEITNWIYENAWKYRDPIAKWRNPEFKKLQDIRKKNPNDPRIKFYDLVLDSLEDSDMWVPQKYRLNWYGLSYSIPRVPKDMSERILELQKPLDIIKNSTNISLAKDKSDIGRGQVGDEGEKKVFLDELDRVKMFIPVYYSGEFDPNNQSYDIATIVTKRYQMALDYRARMDILPEVELSKYFIENRKVVVTDEKGNPVKNAIQFLRKKEQTKEGLNSRLAEQFSDWLKMNFFGNDRAEGRDWTVFGMKINSEKGLDFLNSNTAAAMLAFNAVQGIANLQLAEVMQRVESFAGEFFTMKEYQKAALKYDVYLPKIMGDLANRRTTNLIDHLHERFNTLDDYKISPKFRKKGFFSQQFRRDIAFAFSHMGEHMAQSKAMLAMVDHVKLKDNDGNIVKTKKGKDMTLLDALYVDNKTNSLQILDEGYDNDGNIVKIKKLTDKELHILGFKIQEVLAKMHGDYRDYNKAAWQYYALGRMAGMFRRFIVPGIKRRYAKSRKLEDGTRQFKYNEYGEFSYEGMYNTFGRFFGSILTDLWKMKANILKNKEDKYSFRDSSKYSKLHALEQANIIRTGSEILFLVSATILGSAFLQLKDEADDDRTKWYYSMLAYQALRLKSELFFFANPVETFRILRSPAASMSVIENIIKLIELIINPFDDESAFEKFQRGPWKGKWKGTKYLMNSIGTLAPAKQLMRLTNIEDQIQWFSN